MAAIRRLGRRAPWPVYHGPVGRRTCGLPWAHTLAAAFGALLKTYRLAAGLTQEALAEYAGLGRRSIQTLEGGRHRPHEDTAHRLARALGLGERERALLLAAAMPAPRQRGSVPAPVATTPADAGQPAARRHNLPAALSSFVGRERERGLIRELVARARLVTLTGSGGVGKTRLALAVAADLAEAYRDGVWFVELAALADPALVPGAVAQVLAVREESRRPLLETLTDHLRDRHLLLVLDNCEHRTGRLQLARRGAAAGLPRPGGAGDQPGAPAGGGGAALPRAVPHGPRPAAAGTARAGSRAGGL